MFRKNSLRSTKCGELARLILAAIGCASFTVSDSAMCILNVGHINILGSKVDRALHENWLQAGQPEPNGTMVGER